MSPVLVLLTATVVTQLEPPPAADPPVARLQAAAARCADPFAPFARSRARLAALLPRVTAELRADERSYRVVGLQGTGEVDYARYAPGWIAVLRATWDLGVLASPLEERAALRGALAVARRRDEAVRRVTSLHFERRRLRLALASEPPADAARAAGATLELERLAAEIDALTAGCLAGSAP